LFYDNYLRKRAIPFDICKFPFIDITNIFSSIIIIPSYYEYDYITKTLDSIEKQINFDLTCLLVIVVINNSSNASKEILKNNSQTMKLIQNFNSSYTLEYIDASKGANALSDNLAGVGYARKIGMDFALKYSKEDSIIHCLDADTIVSKDYLADIATAYQKNRIKALIVDFEHQKNNDTHLNKNIQNYESFLKKTATDIDDAGSPYGYVSLGPTITCLASTYVKIGGMVNKKATEDFYFLQQIRKFTDIYFLNKKLVFPSARLSERVYLGTGFRMKELLEDKSIKDLYYSKKSFRILKESICKILSLYNQDLSILNKELETIESSLNMFFTNEGLFKIWFKINKESKNRSQFELQFHKWFDNLKTLRLLKFYS